MASPENAYTKGYHKLLKEGESWKIFSVCAKNVDYDDMNKFRAGKSKAEFFRRLMNMYRKHIGQEPLAD